MGNLNDLELRIESIEKQIANGLRGERGRPGDISAAVANAEKVAAEAAHTLREEVASFRDGVDKELVEAFARIDLYAGREHKSCEASIEQFRASTYAVAEAAAVKTLNDTVLKDQVYQLVFEALADFGVTNPRTGKAFARREYDEKARVGA